jgi:hypothetical protein
MLLFVPISEVVQVTGCIGTDVKPVTFIWKYSVQFLTGAIAILESFLRIFLNTFRRISEKICVILVIRHGILIDNLIY